MDISELKNLGSYNQASGGSSVNTYFCRHSRLIGHYTRSHGYEVLQKCPECAVEIEILQRLERIEGLLQQNAPQSNDE